MHFCEPFLSGAPHAYFGAPCTPVEERWFEAWMKLGSITVISSPWSFQSVCCIKLVCFQTCETKCGAWSWWMLIKLSLRRQMQLKVKQIIWQAKLQLNFFDILMHLCYVSLSMTIARQTNNMQNSDFLCDDTHAIRMHMWIFHQTKFL